MHVHYRECTKDKEIEMNDNKKLKIDKGTMVVIAVYDIERDPEYFGPDADQFNPERFNDENGGIKRYTDKGVLFPFGKIFLLRLGISKNFKNISGDGPRICSGRQFAKTQLKCCIAHLITSFSFSVSKEMPEHPTYDPMDFLLSYKSGVLLNLKPIK